jgi:hypothetical protein
MILTLRTVLARPFSRHEALVAAADHRGGKRVSKGDRRWFVAGARSINAIHDRILPDSQGRYLRR